MKAEEKQELRIDIKQEFKDAKKSFLLKILPFLGDIVEKIIERYLRRKGYID